MQFRIDIENLRRGQERPVKAEIDSLGEEFTSGLSETLGSEEISVQRENASAPYIF